MSEHTKGYWHTVVKPMREELFKRFPRCFAQESNPLHHKRPLKLGIKDDIIARCPDLDEKVVGQALADYVQGKKYAFCCQVGRGRYDLDGRCVGTVTEDEAKFTQQKQKTRAEYLKERNKAKVA